MKNYLTPIISIKNLAFMDCILTSLTEGENELPLIGLDDYSNIP